MKIIDMDISTKLYTTLYDHGIEEFEDISKFSSEDIIYWENLGRRTLEELLLTMKKYNVYFNKKAGGKHE